MAIATGQAAGHDVAVSGTAGPAVDAGSLPAMSATVSSLSHSKSVKPTTRGSPAVGGGARPRRRWSRTPCGIRITVEVDLRSQLRGDHDEVLSDAAARLTGLIGVSDDEPAGVAPDIVEIRGWILVRRMGYLAAAIPGRAPISDRRELATCEVKHEALVEVAARTGADGAAFEVQVLADEADKAATYAALAVRGWLTHDLVAGAGVLDDHGRRRDVSAVDPGSQGSSVVGDDRVLSSRRSLVPSGHAQPADLMRASPSLNHTVRRFVLNCGQSEVDEPVVGHVHLLAQPGPVSTRRSSK